MSNKIWIDTRTGTWGTNTDELVIVDLDEVARINSLNGDPVDAWSLIGFLEDSSDQEIAGYGREYGVAAVEDSAKEWLIVATPGADAGTWWNNVQGWVAPESEATRFTEHERRTLRLPLGGEWIRPGAVIYQGTCTCDPHDSDPHEPDCPLFDPATPND